MSTARLSQKLRFAMSKLLPVDVPLHAWTLTCGAAHQDGSS
ncbi:MAG TPA: hypothetical protein PLD57_00955 [Aggregatilineales bacterium]|nr:hypothetical protein [Aggregatilineales bacterium]